jgi:hypothetical protein
MKIMGKIFYVILSFALLIFGHLFSINLTKDFSLGDTILETIGLRAWQSKTLINNFEYDSGIHLTVFYGLGIMILSWIIANVTMKNDYPKLYKTIPLFVVFLLFFSPSIISHYTN